MYIGKIVCENAYENNSGSDCSGYLGWSNTNMIGSIWGNVTQGGQGMEIPP
jgi:hypothetical protein